MVVPWFVDKRTIDDGQAGENGADFSVRLFLKVRRGDGVYRLLNEVLLAHALFFELFQHLSQSTLSPDQSFPSIPALLLLCFSAATHQDEDVGEIVLAMGCDPRDFLFFREAGKFKPMLELKISLEVLCTL